MLRFTRQSAAPRFRRLGPFGLATAGTATSAAFFQYRGVAAAASSSSSSSYSYSHHSRGSQSSHHHQQRRQQQQGSSARGGAKAAVNYYRRLEVSTDATAAEIKAAYRRQALRWHPDVVEDARKAEAEARFRGISEAFEVLQDPARRRQHDQALGIDSKRKTAKAATAAATPDGAARPGGRGEFAGRTRARTSAAAAAAGSSSTASASRSRAATGGGGASWFDPDGKKSGGSTTATHHRQQQQQRRKPFVRGDADRVFRDAFDGKSLEQILFEFRRQQRAEAVREAGRQAAAAAKGSDASTASASVSSSPGLEGEAAHTAEESMRRVVARAAEEFAHRARRQYGQDVLDKVFLHRRRGFQAGAAAASSSGSPPPPPPPSSHMPFRPFANFPVPEGVTVPPTPTLGPLVDGSQPYARVAGENEQQDENKTDSMVAAVNASHDAPSDADSTAADSAALVLDAESSHGTDESGNAFKPIDFDAAELAEGEHTMENGHTRAGGPLRFGPEQKDPDRSRFDTLDHYRDNITRGAHNGGQLYSYQRPY